MNNKLNLTINQMFAHNPHFEIVHPMKWRTSCVEDEMILIFDYIEYIGENT